MQGMTRNGPARLVNYSNSELLSGWSGSWCWV